jgi:hypothetical protein
LAFPTKTIHMTYILYEILFLVKNGLVKIVLGGINQMKLREFVDSFVPFKEPKVDEKAIPNEVKEKDGSFTSGPVNVDKNICAGCGKKIVKGEKWFGDNEGKVYHEKCYNAKFGNLDKSTYGSNFPEGDEQPIVNSERKKSMAKSKEPKKEPKKAPKSTEKKAPAKKK